MSVWSKETDESLVVAIVFTESSSRRLRLFGPRRTPSGAFKKPLCRSAELVAFVRKAEADRDEVLEELVEPLDVARRIGRKVTCPLDSPLEGGIRAALAVNVPPPGRFQHDQRIRRRLLTGEPTGDGFDFVGDVGGIDLC